MSSGQQNPMKIAPAGSKSPSPSSSIGTTTTNTDTTAEPSDASNLVIQLF